MLMNKTFVLLTGIALLGSFESVPSVAAEPRLPRITAERHSPSPGCVHTSLRDAGWTDYLRVTNTCPTYQRVKVLLAFRTDFPCITYAPRDAYDYEWDYPGRFDGLAAC
jgi:hypothetical protein